MRKKLFTKAIDNLLFKQFALGSDLEKQKVAAKIFNPYGRGRWYILNSDPEDPDYLWAIVEMGDEIEIGSVSREDLETIKVPPFKLNLERDIYFTPINAKEVYDGLRRGQFFAKGGNTDVQLVENQTNEYYITESDADSDSMAIKLAKGGSIDEIANKLQGKMVRYNLLGGGSGTFVIDSVLVTPANFVHRTVNLYTKQGSVDSLPLDKIDDFITGKEVKIMDSKGEPYTLELVGRLEDGGTTDIGGTEYNSEDLSGMFEHGGRLTVSKKYDSVSEYMKYAKKGDLVLVGKGEDVLEYASDSYLDKFVEVKDGEAIFKKFGRKGLISYPNHYSVIVVNRKYEHGGKIKDQYEGRTPEDVWNNLSKQQRQHFLYDHSEDIEDYRGEEYGELTSKEIIKAYNSDYSELDKNVRNRFDNHVREGQYADGGMMGNDGQVTYGDLKIGEIYYQVKRPDLGIEKIKITEKSNGRYSYSSDYDNFGEETSVSKYQGKYTENEKLYGIYSDKNLAKKKAISLLEEAMSKYADGGMMAKGGDIDFDYELKVQPDFKYKNTANRWLEDNSKDSLKYKLAVLLLRGKKDADEILGIKNYGQYASMLRSLEKISGESKHEMSWRTQDYTLNNAEKWATDSLRDVFYVHATHNKMAKGGEKFYAVIDIYNNPITLEANSKEEMLNMLNKTYKQSTGEEYVPYSISDLEDAIYMGKKLDHVISDDWASVTKNKDVFQKDIELFKKHYADGGIMAKGGKTKFMDKVKSIQSSLLKRKKVSPSVQKDYGKTYSKTEALESAKRIAGALRAKELAKKKR